MLLEAERCRRKSAKVEDFIDDRAFLLLLSRDGNIQDIRNMPLENKDLTFRERGQTLRPLDPIRFKRRPSEQRIWLSL